MRSSQRPGEPTAKAARGLLQLGAFQPGPYPAICSANKAFVLSFSEALWAEYRA